MKVAGVLLASGASRRLGKPKQLMQWRGSLLIDHIIGIINDSNIDSLFVVLGFQKSKLEKLIINPCNIIYNANWQEGKSESIKRGLVEIKDEYDAAIIFTTDQPFLSPKLINSLIEKTLLTDAEIIATRNKNIATVPMLFRKTCFEFLNELEGDEGGKKLLNNLDFNIQFQDWEDSRILIDIDTMAGYHQALKADNNNNEIN